MLRGTVYLVFDPEAETPRIERHVLTLDVETIAAFREQAPNIVRAPMGAVLEFGPIGPSWGMT